MLSPVIARLNRASLILGKGAMQVNAVRELSLELRKGETTAIIGPSGAGKTSLLMLLSGLEKPTYGEVEIMGQSTSNLSESELADLRARHIGVVFQAFHLVPAMTALENVALPLWLKGDADAERKAATWLSAVGLTERMNHKPGELSGGEQQRVAVARAFVAEPELLLADEPTGNLDEATGEMVMKLVFDLCRERGSTLVLVTHNPELAKKCSNVLRLRSGVLEAA